VTRTGHRFEEVVFATLPEEVCELLREAKSALNGAYNPYSHFFVGSALRLKGGDIVAGANTENAAYGSSICSERTALMTAQAQGSGNDCTAIAIVTSRHDGPTTHISTPCGECRQVLWEFACRSKVYDDFSIVLATTNFEKIFQTTIGYLLPRPFGPADLEISETGGAMQ